MVSAGGGLGTLAITPQTNYAILLNLPLSIGDDDVSGCTRWEMLPWEES
jgi:hypothetical protein